MRNQSTGSCLSRSSRLQLPITKASREVVFINTSPIEDRSHILKGRATLENMSQESTDVEVSNDMKQYSKRPKLFETLRLAYYVSKLKVILPNVWLHVRL